MTYPTVLAEADTVRVLRDSGASIARFGDAECKVMEGSSENRQAYTDELADELRTICAKPKHHCMSAVLPWHPSSPKAYFLERFRPRFRPFLTERVVYGSALISRSDIAPWIDTPEFASEVIHLWSGQDVTVICRPTGKGGKLLTLALATARSVHHIPCPKNGAYDIVGQLERDARAAARPVTLMAAGVAATCLADRLCDTTQALDLGHAPGYLLKWWRSGLCLP